jgi:NADH:ubiquinone oxidoreductase subunit H
MIDNFLLDFLYLSNIVSEIITNDDYYKDFLQIVKTNKVIVVNFNYNIFINENEIIFKNINWQIVNLFVIINILIVIIPVLVSVAFLTLLERKIMAAIQRRRGPNIIGFFGLLQPFADGLKLLTKEFNIPGRSFDFLVLITPMLSLMFTCSCFSLVPLGYSYISFTTNNISALYVMAISSLNIYSIIMAGWASKSAYAFLGSLRASAQFISYEVSLTLNIMGIFLISGSFNLSEISYIQEESLPNIFIMFPVFILYLVGILSETNRTPFDLAEAESELVAGYGVEFSAVGFAYFFIAEYGSIILYCLLTLVFFGGGLFHFLKYIISCFLFLPYLIINCIYIKEHIEEFNFLYNFFSSEFILISKITLKLFIENFFSIIVNDLLILNDIVIDKDSFIKCYEKCYDEYFIMSYKDSEGQFKVTFISPYTYIFYKFYPLLSYFEFFRLFMLSEISDFFLTITVLPLFLENNYIIPSFFLMFIECFFFGCQIVLILVLFCYIRATYARFRFDQLMKLNWKNLLILSLSLDLYISIIIKFSIIIKYFDFFFFFNNLWFFLTIWLDFR